VQAPATVEMIIDVKRISGMRGNICVNDWSPKLGAGFEAATAEGFKPGCNENLRSLLENLVSPTQR